MQLSYTSRVICLALCSAGLLQALLEWTAWALSPLLLRGRNARRTERSLFLLVFAARLAPWLLVSGLLVPAYLRGEDNSSIERVGLACLALAACVLLSSIAGVVRVLLAAYAVSRCCRQCRAMQYGPNDLPLLLYPGERALMAVAGVFSPRVIVSQPLLDANRFSSAELAVALAHEAAHIRHRDNLKVLLLSLLPHVPAAATARPSLQQCWRLAAELAADEDGSQGEPGRALLLAQLLLALARGAGRELPQDLVAFVADPTHLQVRVERLLATGNRTPSDKSFREAAYDTLCPLAASAGMLAPLSCVCIFFGHRIAEFLLHLG